MGISTESNNGGIVSGSGSALNADLLVQDVTYIENIFVQLTGTFSATVTFQGSNDTLNWENVLALNANAVNTAPFVSTSSTGLYIIPANFAWLRVRITSYTSGTVTATALVTENSPLPLFAATTSTSSSDTGYGVVGINTLRTAAQIGNATGAADFNAGNASNQTLRVVVATNQSAIPVTGTFWQTTQPISGTVTANQGTSPWVISGSVSLSDDHNYGTVSATTLRSAAQIGNATGAADFGAGATSGQTLRTVSNQGAPNTIANAWPTKITDGTNTVSVSPNSEQKVYDTCNNGGVNADIVVGITAVEGKVGVSRLANRKYVVVEPLDSDIYFGFSSSVTTSNGIPIFKNQILMFPIGDSTQIWFISGTAGKRIRFGELA